MDKKLFNESVGKMLSLMDRMNGNMTPYEAMLNEEKRIAEALENGRTLVQANNLYDVISNMESGGFASFGYVMSANLNLPTVKRKNPATNRMKGYLDSDTLGQQLNYPGEKIAGIIKFTRYLVNWSTPDSIKKKYANYKTSFNNMCDEYGCGDGAKIADKEKNYAATQEYGKHGVSSYVGDNDEKMGNTYSDQNIHGAKRTSTYFLVDIDGNIVREVNKDEIKDYFKPRAEHSSELTRVIKAMKELGAEDAKIQEVIERVNNLNMKYQKFLLPNILYIVGATKTEDGQTKKIIFLNDAMKDSFKNGFDEFKVNMHQFREMEMEKRNIDMQDVINALETQG